MATMTETVLRTQLLGRRERLVTAVRSREDARLAQLLSEVDAALERMDDGSYGLCKVCHEPIEADTLLSNPLLEYCLPHRTLEQQRALEQDLSLAARIQSGLLPRNNQSASGWTVHYHYEPAGPVSGDYCDVVPGNGDGGLYFLMGDVSGKGIASSILMSHLHAMFRSLLPSEPCLEQLIGRANHLFCESTMPSSYATLVCGKALPGGDVEICNAGHCPPVVIRQGERSNVAPHGLPIGLFPEGRYSSTKTHLDPGDALFLYTDGLSEARNTAGTEYGPERLSQLIGDCHSLPPQELTKACIDDLTKFLGGQSKSDDLTVMVLKRES